MHFFFKKLKSSLDLIKLAFAKHVGLQLVVVSKKPNRKPNDCGASVREVVNSIRDDGLTRPG